MDVRLTSSPAVEGINHKADVSDKSPES